MSAHVGLFEHWVPHSIHCFIITFLYFPGYSTASWECLPLSDRPKCFTLRGFEIDSNHEWLTVWHPITHSSWLPIVCSWSCRCQKPIKPQKDPLDSSGLYCIPLIQSLSKVNPLCLTASHVALHNAVKASVCSPWDAQNQPPKGCRKAGILENLRKMII
jgi:hypothetical protein